MTTTDPYTYLLDLFTDIGTGWRDVDLTDPYTCRQLADEAITEISHMYAMAPDW